MPFLTGLQVLSCSNLPVEDNTHQQFLARFMIKEARAARSEHSVRPLPSSLPNPQRKQSKLQARLAVFPRALVEGIRAATNLVTRPALLQRCGSTLSRPQSCAYKHTQRQTNAAVTCVFLLCRSGALANLSQIKPHGHKGPPGKRSRHARENVWEAEP